MAAPSSSKGKGPAPPAKPSKPSNVFTKMLSPVALRLSISNPLIFLNPQPPNLLPELPDQEDDGRPPREDIVLSGNVVLSLAKPVRIEALVVSLRCHSEINFPDRAFEKALIFDRDLEIKLGDETLKTGDHAFEWSFVIPTDVPTFERGNPFGTTKHVVKARTKGAGVLGDVEKVLPWWPVASPKLETNPDDVDPGMVPTLDIRYEDTSPLLGPYLLKLTSNLFTISGLLAFSLTFPCIASSKVTIHHIICYITQHYQLRSTSGAQVTAPSQRRLVFALGGNKADKHTEREHSPPAAASVLTTSPPTSVPTSPAASPRVDRAPLTLNNPPPGPSRPRLDHRTSDHSHRGRGPRSPTHSTTAIPPLMTKSKSRSHSAGVPLSPQPPPPLAVLTADQPFTASHLARLPNDSLLRPTTYPGTKTPIRVSHTMSILVSYTATDPAGARPEGEEGEGQKKALEISKPVHIVSCWCMLEALSLPPYSWCDPHEEMHDPVHQDQARMRCVCGKSMQDLLQTQDPTPREDGPADELAGLGWTTKDL